jgi:hypothetical protein
MSQPLNSGSPNSINPYQFTAEQKPLESGAQPGGLGSLAQASRGQQLNSARTTLIVIGVLTLVVNVIFMALIPGQIRSELAKNGQVLPEEAMAVATGIAMAIQGIFVLLGVLFIVLGTLVKRFPVPCTLTALVLYILAALVTAAIDPTTLLQGIIIKVIIVVALFKAVQTAFAYQKELQAAGA